MTIYRQDPRHANAAIAAAVRAIATGTAPTSVEDVVFDETNTGRTEVIGAGFQSEVFIGGKAVDEDITIKLYGRLRLRAEDAADGHVETDWVQIGASAGVTLTAGADFSVTRLALSDEVLWPNEFKITWNSSGTPGAGSQVAFIAG